MKTLVFALVCLANFAPAFVRCTSEVEELKDGPGETIVGGNVTDISKIPYQVSILIRNGEDYYGCGGSILSDIFIISAGHCFKNGSSIVPAGNVIVRAGSNYWIKGGQAVFAKKITIHPKFLHVIGRFLDYDVSILTLKTPLNLSSSLNQLPVILSESGTQWNNKEPAQVSGWGRTSNNSTENSELLKQTTVFILNKKTCSTVWGDRFTERMLCTYRIDENNEPTNFCKGDSGGPLVFYGTYKLIGIISFSLNCTAKGVPGVYTNIANPEIRDFIKKETGL